MNQTSLEQLETLTRAGSFAPVVKHLTEINTKKIPRVEIARYANLANRVDFARFTMRVLNPIVRGEEGLLVPANDAEKSEYADALRRMGLVGEAVQIFSEVDSVKHPVVLLRTALCLFNQWKYDEAIPHLEKYRKAVENDAYARRIATLNLAAAYVAERLDERALRLLKPLRNETKAANNQLLYMNTLELMTQVFVRLNAWNAVDDAMAEAAHVATDASTRYARYVRKWKSIADSLKSGVVSQDLYACRAEAETNRDWETIRECDLYISHIARDRKLLEQLYFGTPYPSYRKRILDLVGPDLPQQRDHLWYPGKAPSSPRATIRLSLGAIENGESALETGQVPHRLLILLCRDFYRPLTQGAAFSNLYAGEHFMQQGSTNRVCQSVRRLRAWLEEVAPGLEVEVVDGSYRLRGDGSVGIRVPREPLPLDVRPLEWHAVKLAVDKNLFSKRDVMRVQNCSDSAAKRLLNWALENGRAQTVEWGAKTKYKIVAA